MIRKIALLAALALLGCQGKPTTVRISLALESGMQVPSTVAISLYDRYGRLIESGDLGTGMKLPGDLVVLVSPNSPEMRVHAFGLNGTMIYCGAVGTFPVADGKESRIALTLAPAIPADGDRDGVPDAIDNCPNTANADQASSNGDTQGDACKSTANVTNPGGGTMPSSTTCGDGTTQMGEQCDDGANNSDDALNTNATCTTQCKKRASCGTGANAAAQKIDPTSGHCYVAYSTPENWATAHDSCRKAGGYLASITSQEENDLVKTVAAGIRWIGLVAPAMTPHTFSWASGEMLSFMSFGVAPSMTAQAECGESANGTWSDVDCGWPTGAGTTLTQRAAKTNAYVCEHSCGNGIIETGEECDGGANCTASCEKKRTCAAGETQSPVNGHCYFVVQTNVNYAGAAGLCSARNAHLATLNAPHESELTKTVVGANEPWIALSSASAGAFGWDFNNENFNPRRYHGFIAGEPNNTAAACVRQTSAGWRDDDCGNTHFALCERE